MAALRNADGESVPLEIKTLRLAGFQRRPASAGRPPHEKADLAGPGTA